MKCPPPPVSGSLASVDWDHGAPIRQQMGCEVHAFTTSESKETEARQLGAHYVHNSRKDGALKKLGGSLDLIISTINAPLDVSLSSTPSRPKVASTM